MQWRIFWYFLDTLLEIVNKYPPYEMFHVRENHYPFIDKIILRNMWTRLEIDTWNLEVTRATEFIISREISKWISREISKWNLSKKIFLWKLRSWFENCFKKSIRLHVRVYKSRRTWRTWKKLEKVQNSQDHIIK